MATLKEIEVQKGEWWEVGGKITDPVTKAAKDVSGKSVAAVVRSGPKESDPLVTVTGEIGAVVDGPSGDVAAGGRIASVGTYYGTLTVGAESDGAGWPVKERFGLKVTDCP
jgi:hypothetical protein